MPGWRRAGIDLLSAAGRRLRHGGRRPPGNGNGADAVPAVVVAPVAAASTVPAAPTVSDSTRADRFAALLSGMTDGVMMMDADLHLLEWNARFPDCTGVPPEQLHVGMSLEEILRAQAKAGEFGEVDIEAEVARRLEQIRRGLSLGTIERRRPNGQVLELRRNRLPDGGYVTLYTDITARRQAEDQLHQTQKMEAVGHLTGGVAHDFNNLLMVILGNLDRAERSIKELDLDRAGRSIEQARSGAKRAALLTQRLLAFSRQQLREPRPVDPNAIVLGMADLIRQSSASALGVDFALVDCPWIVLADPNQFEIALLNLVINARDAMAEGGSVRIETARATRGDPGVPDPLPIAGQEFMRITVRDTGSGMSPEVVARAFEPFFTTKPAGKGTGLGLYQVIEFATHAGGHVAIDSHPGTGTAVTIILPRLQVSEKAGTSVVQVSDPCIGHGETVLVVEDQPEILACTAEGLQSLGYHVIGAKDASGALTALENNPGVALLFTDTGLAGISGHQLTEEVARRWPSLPILATSGGPAALSPEEGAPSRELALIEKPYVVPRLAEAIRAILDARLAVPGADRPDTPAAPGT
ncbi:response regulator [Roseomonas sp. KE2513]|uniref:PAS-domain containing protein n=1 Tax=Roseomonas sp. KE2513 TaxID=2479202 RepID=UPI0018DFD543|nr:PAS-domain containing protein [Roseomonas sp. KE2513]MBI0536235.1 response regulator [Roseomonas sp. KE2513]